MTMLRRHSAALWATITVSVVLSSATNLRAQWEGDKNTRLLKKIEETFGEPKGATRLDPVSRVWADKKNSRIIVDGVIALREGQLEMLACIVGTKEHESVVALYSRAHLIHAGLLAVGAKKGTPVKWRPEYQPPTGSAIRVVALWKDKDGKKHATDSRRWVRETGSASKTLDVDFVFAGSILYKDPETGKEHYEAEQGDVICVANFSTATMDVPLRSLKSNSLLSYMAFTDRIPETETPVRLVLEVLKDKKVETPAVGTVDVKPSAEGAAVDAAGAKPFSLAGYERLLDAPAVKQVAGDSETPAVTSSATTPER